MRQKRRYTYNDNPELCRRFQDGDKSAAEILCRVNMQLARKCADNAARIYGNGWRDDFLQEALIGILDAAGRYDAKLGAFSTYAMWYIQNHIQQFAVNRYNVKIPQNTQMLISRVDKLDGELQELPLNERMQKIAEKLNLPVKKVEWILCVRYRFRHSNSLSVPINEDQELLLQEVIPDDDEDSIGIMLDQTMAADIVPRILQQLSPREQEIIRLRCGFDDGGCLTLKEVGKKFGINQERVRQIEAKALRKLRFYIKAYATREDVFSDAASY